MRLLLVLIGFALIANSASADNRLLGSWKSDHDQTMRFVHEYARLKSKQLEFLDQTIGHLVLGFTENTATYSMPDLQVQIQNKKHQLKGMNENNTYSVIGSDTNTVVISVSSTNNVSHIVVYHFQDDDTMWVYPDDAIDGLATLNIREYFRRVRK